MVKYTGKKKWLNSTSTPPVKVEQLIAWSRREKIKTQGEKISYIFPRLKHANTVTEKDCVQREKYDLISLMPYFPPQYTVCDSRTIIAWPKGEKISYIFPPLEFCALLT